MRKAIKEESNNRAIQLNNRALDTKAALNDLQDMIQKISSDGADLVLVGLFWVILGLILSTFAGQIDDQLANKVECPPASVLPLPRSVEKPLLMA